MKTLVTRPKEIMIEATPAPDLTRRGETTCPPFIQTFKILHKFNIKLNPTKCLFWVKVGKSLGYLVTKRDIKANLDQIRPILNIAEPKNKKYVQKVGRLRALTRFIPKATKKIQSLFEAIKKV